MDYEKFIIDKFSHFCLTDEELKAILGIIHSYSLKRNQLFLESGNKSENVGLLLDGLLYSFSMDENGEENIHDFFYSPNQFIVFNYEDYLMEQSSKLSIRCFQESTMLVFSMENANALFEKFPRFYQFQTSIMQQHFVQALQRNSILQAKNAMDKIKAAQWRAPEIFRLFPFSYVASYLGMHRNTFKRALKEI